ncbi:uS2 family ribosomal protein [Patescibacteria group bacterium]|nr:uS2 family ribosomal protein [Patescibacteria group bacterium]MBU1757809.1 uS2 family ribosomal protein [Patescibacteria group bacterium]
MTNFETLKKRIDSMNSMARFMETEAFGKLTKKEQLVHERKLKRVKKIYGGVKEMEKKPDFVIVVDAEMMSSFINEIEKTKDIESVLIAGTNFSRRRKEDSLILANVLGHKSIDFILRNILS